METGIKSSFIPSDATSLSSSPRIPTRTGFADLLVLISIVLVVASVALAAAVFLYLQYMQTSSASKLEQLERAKDAFEPSLIQELTRLDDRMRAGSQVLQNHIAPTAFFRVLEQLTLQTVAFGNLDFQAVDHQNITIKMAGLAASVNSIALQADYMSRSGMITSPIFSNINRAAGGFQFELAANINPSSLRYAQIGFAPAPVDPQAPPPEDGEADPFNVPDEQMAPPEGLPVPPEGLPEPPADITEEL